MAQVPPGVQSSLLQWVSKPTFVRLQASSCGPRAAEANTLPTLETFKRKLKTDPDENLWQSLLIE